MKNYETPSFDVISVAETDVIVTSFGGDTPLTDEKWSW